MKTRTIRSIAARTMAIAATLGLVTTAAAADESIRVFVVKEKKGEIVAPVARDTGFVARSLAKRFGVKAPRGKTSVLALEFPASVWDASKVDVAKILSKRGLAAVVVDDAPDLGSGWANGVSIKKRHPMALAQQVEIDIWLAGRDTRELARSVMLDDMHRRVAGARARNARGDVAGKPSEDKQSSGLRRGTYDIDFGPNGRRVSIDCTNPDNADICELSEHDGDTDPAPNEDDGDADESDLPFDRPDCNPFVDAECGGSDPCSLGLAPGNPLSEALGCGFLETAEAGAIGPRSDPDQEAAPDEEEPDFADIEWDPDDYHCDTDNAGVTWCLGSGSFMVEDVNGFCTKTCHAIVCAFDADVVCSAGLCESTGCSE